MAGFKIECSGYNVCYRRHDRNLYTLSSYFMQSLVVYNVGNIYTRESLMIEPLTPPAHDILDKIGINALRFFVVDTIECRDRFNQGSGLQFSWEES